MRSASLALDPGALHPPFQSGNFEPGKRFDASLVDVGVKEDVINASGWEGDNQTLVKRWVFLGDDRSIRTVWVNGRLVAGHDAVL